MSFRDDAPSGRWHDFLDLSDTGMLWLINRVVFHPRGFAFAVTEDEHGRLGWQIFGDGTEPVVFTSEEDEDLKFRIAENFLNRHKEKR
jgi:hypothetical protein